MFRNSRPTAAPSCSSAPSARRVKSSPRKHSAPACPLSIIAGSAGVCTIFRTVKVSIKRLKDLETMGQDGTFDKMSKREALTLQREMEKLTRSLGGIKEMNALPDALFIIDVGYQKIAVTEANKLSIPIVGVVDTNHSTDGIAYVIPGNDDSSRAIRLYARGVADAILEGKSQVIQEILQTEEFVEVSGDEAAKLR